MENVLTPTYQTRFESKKQAVGDVVELVFNEDVYTVGTALQAFLALEPDVEKSSLKESLVTVQGYILEDKQNSTGFFVAINQLDDETNGDEFATYLLEWIETWRNDPNYSNEVAIGDLTSAEEVNRALGCVMDWLNACCDRFNIVIQHRTYFQQFVESCKKVLPALPDKRELDYTHEVTEDELNAVNQYAKDILKVYGGADFIVDWSKREGNEGCSYPVNADTDIEFTKDNVQFMVSDIVSRAYYENNEEEKKDGIWNNWNYMHELMNLKTISLKQNDDLAHLIIEAIGWQVPKYEKPVSLEITLPDEIELGEGEQHYTYQRFANLESALALVNDERADYDIMIL